MATLSLKERYKKEIIPHLKKKLNCRSVMEVPKLVAVHISQGLGDAKTNQKVLDTAIEEISNITGQRPVKTKAKKSISNFKLRAGMQVGVHITLRGTRMYEFVQRFITFALPRQRDFSGISEKSFDGRGNYTYGIKEQIIFHEISIDKVPKIRGMNATFVTTAKNDQTGYELLKALGLPFKNMHQTK